VSKKVKRESPVARRLRERVEELERTIADLESKLSESVSKTVHARSLKQIKHLKAKLAESIPKAEYDTKVEGLQSEVGKLEARLAESVPKSEADQLKDMIKELEAKLADSMPKFGFVIGRLQSELEEARAKIRALEATKPTQTTEAGLP